MTDRRRALMAKKTQEPNGFAPGEYPVTSIGTTYRVIVNDDGTISWPDGMSTAPTPTVPLKQAVAVEAGDTIRIVITKVSGTNRFNYFDAALFDPTNYQIASNAQWANANKIYEASITANTSGTFSRFKTRFRSQNLSTALTFRVSVYINEEQVI